MSENKLPDPGKEALPVPGVDVKIYLPKDPEKDHGKLLGFASVNLGGVFAVNNIRIYDSEKGPFVTMPGKKGQDGKYHDICCPTTKEMREALNTAVMGEYHRAVERIASRGEQAMQKSSVLNSLNQKKAQVAEQPTAPKKNMDRGER